MFKKKWLLPVGVIAFVILYFCFNPPSIQIGDTVIFATYRANPQTAYYDNPISLAVEGGTIDIVKDISTVDITEDYSVYISMSESGMYDNSVLFCLMKRQNDKYYFMQEIDRANLNYSLKDEKHTIKTKEGNIEFLFITKDSFEDKKLQYEQKYEFENLVFEDNNNVKYDVVFAYRFES